MNLSITVNKRKSKKTKKGFPIIVYASHDYQDKEWRTGYYTELSDWNSQRSVPKAKHPQYYFLLDYLNALKVRLNEISLESTKRPLSFEEAKTWVFNENRDSFYQSAMNLFEEGYRGTDWSAIRRFNKYYPYSSFTNVSNEIALGFRDELLKQGNKPSGVDSYIRSLKALWNRLSNKPNPFKGVVTEIPDTVKRVASHQDLLKLIQSEIPNNTGFSGFYHYRNYWLLMFYLGGIDPEVLAKLRYDKHLINGRIVFNRDKGRSKTACNNLIAEQAWTILEQYKKPDCPYFVPIHLSSNYKTFSGNFCRRLRELSRKLDLSIELRPKSARYTFIDRAQQLLIDERVTAQIVGHKRRTTTSIYTNDFPLNFQDDAHLKIITV
ncbi:site-specific integrase [Muricauda sp. CAU 1633]|uniref:site-specific integrase n=1 Tax=Allomuricauda sp. CAU 1633 TaxID=2816036 RepID=UPI001A8FF451|nr:site-specific integrase [Muricauda sp. CAU 1633]MBO0323677.1 site-specific integrase [Muricauda sp. CAU 1633]